MTTPPMDEDVLAPRQPKATSFIDWFHVNSRWVAIGAVVIAVGAGVAWYVPHQRVMASENADRMLLDAKRSLNSGNAQLAESDLKKVADRYAGTPSGTEAGMLIGQLHLEKGETAAAVTSLRDLVSKVGSGSSAAAARGLLGDALSQSGKAAEAAAEYERAAEATSLANEKAGLLGKAAYAYMAAGNAAKARSIFERLVADGGSPALAAEARVRLGELNAKG